MQCLCIIIYIYKIILLYLTIQEHFYNNGHGFIECRLKNIRTARPEERRNSRKQIAPTIAIQGIQEEKVPDCAISQDLKEKVYIVYYYRNTLYNYNLVIIIKTTDRTTTTLS